MSILYNLMMQRYLYFHRNPKYFEKEAAPFKKSSIFAV